MLGRIVVTPPRLPVTPGSHDGATWAGKMICRSADRVSNTLEPLEVTQVADKQQAATSEGHDSYISLADCKSLPGSRNVQVALAGSYGCTRAFRSVI